MYTRYAPVGGCANNPLKPAKRLKNSRQHSQYKLAMVHCLISVRGKKGSYSKFMLTSEDGDLIKHQKLMWIKCCCYCVDCLLEGAKQKLLCCKMTTRGCITDVALHLKSVTHNLVEGSYLDCNCFLQSSHAHFASQRQSTRCLPQIVYWVPINHLHAVIWKTWWCVKNEHKTWHNSAPKRV